MRYLVMLVALVATTRDASACGEPPDLGTILAGLGPVFEPKIEPIETPLVAIGGGISTEGVTGSLLVGYGWGERDRGGILPGSALSRVMVGVRRDEADTAVSLTYGWYLKISASAAFDFGIEHDGGTGPIARFTLGSGGIAARIGGGVMFGDGDPRATGQVEIVIEVMDLVNKI